MDTDENKGKGKTATNQTVGVEIDALRQENAEQKLTIISLTDRVTIAEKQLAEANKFIESDVRESKIKRIMGKSNYTRDELDQQYPVGDPEALVSLQKLDESLSRGLGVATPKGKGTFKPISSAAADAADDGFPKIYGLKHDAVLKIASEM